MKPSGRAWVAGLVLIAAWALLGFFYAHNTGLTWLPKAGLAAAVLAPAAFIALYTALGVAGPAKWWRSDVGINMVWLEIAAIVTNGLIAWAVWFNGGILNTPELAWAYIGGLFAGAVIITWRSLIFLRAYRKESPLLARIRELEAEVAGLRQGNATGGDHGR